MSDDSEIFHVKDATVDEYQTFLAEKYRSPSKGGNTGALHNHVLTIDGETFSFQAVGAKKWVFKSDTVSFSYKIAKGKYRNILKDTVKVLDKDGKPQMRGDRSFKKKLRTASQSPPASVREQRS